MEVVTYANLIKLYNLSVYLFCIYYISTKLLSEKEKVNLNRR